jgi:hypothetical protein
MRDVAKTAGLDRPSILTVGSEALQSDTSSKTAWQRQYMFRTTKDLLRQVMSLGSVYINALSLVSLKYNYVKEELFHYTHMSGAVGVYDADAVCSRSADGVLGPVLLS